MSLKTYPEKLYPTLSMKVDTRKDVAIKNTEQPTEEGSKALSEAQKTSR